MVPQQEILPYVQLEGSSEEVGFQHGKRLRDRVRANYDFYTMTLFDEPDFGYEACGLKFLDVLGAHCPDFALEIEALARGAGMASWQIMILNARTEVYHQANENLLKECTALMFPQSGLLGQNWDWMRPLEQLMVLTEIRKKGQPRILMMTEPGIIGKIGMNSEGIGVCLNILLGDKPLTALPIHIIQRKILECSSLEEVWEQVTSLPTGTYSHSLVGDRTGRHLSLEFGFDQVHKVSYTHEIPLHANHFLAHPYDGAFSKNPMVSDSHIRTQRAEYLRANLKNQDLNSMKELLLDQANDKQAICKDYQPVWNVELGTLCTIIMDLKQATLHISKGNPCYHGFHSYSLA